MWGNLAVWRKTWWVGKKSKGRERELGSQLIEPMWPSICYSLLCHNKAFPRELQQIGHTLEKGCRDRCDSTTCTVRVFEFCLNSALFGYLIKIHMSSKKKKKSLFLLLSHKMWKNKNDSTSSMKLSLFSCLHEDLEALGWTKDLCEF